MESSTLTAIQISLWPRVPLWVLKGAALISFSVSTLVAAPAPQDNVAPGLEQFQGAALFRQHCANCHAAENHGGALQREALRQLPPETILKSLTSGGMAPNAKALTDTEKRAVSVFLAGRPFGATLPAQASAMPNQCVAKPLGDISSSPMWNGWGVDLSNSRYQPASAARLTAAQVPKLKLKWAFGFPNASTVYGQPTIVGKRVFVGVDTGFVYSLDAASGCVYWSFEAVAGVRTAITVASITGVGAVRFAAYFGDVEANLYAVDAETGRLIWTKRVDTHSLARITGAPALAGGRLYVPVASLEEGVGANPTYDCCTFRGSVVAYDARDGQQLWKAYTIAEAPKPTKKTSSGTQLWAPAGAGIWSAPTIDLKSRAVYVATGDGYTTPSVDTADAVMAFDLDTGKQLWSRQLTEEDAYLNACEPNRPNRSENCPNPLGPDFDFGQSLILSTLPNGRRILAIGQKSGIVWGLDPDKQGAILWQHRIGKGGILGGLMWGGAADDQVAYFPNSDQEHGAEAGGLAAIKLANGERLWFTKPPAPKCAPWTPRIGVLDMQSCTSAQAAAASLIPGVVFSGAMDGTIRAYATANGRILWEYNTAREYSTVNGVPAKGGTLSGPGPTIVDGMLFMGSGYGLYGMGTTGNVLLAFGVATVQLEGD